MATRLISILFLFFLTTAELGFFLPPAAYAESKKEVKKPKKEEKKSSKHVKEKAKEKPANKKELHSKKEPEKEEVLEKEEIKGEEILDPKKLETEATEVGKIDAVLIIDSSRSMQKTDPGKLREQAAKLFFRLLSEGDRLAIISFDKETRQVLPLTEINLETIATFDRAIAAIQYEGGFTDIEAPIAAAYKLLSEQGRPEVLKSVLLFSDGKMDPYPERGTAEELIRQTEKVDLPRYKSSKIKLYTVALSEQADRELLSGFAKLTDGVNLYAPDSSLIHKKFGELFLSIKKPQMITLSGGSFEIDSAVKEVTFFISRNDALATLSLLDPLGNVIAPDDFVSKIKWYSDDKVDLITIYEPLIGHWQIRSNEKIEGFARLLSDPKLHVKFPAGNFKFGESAAAYAKLINMQEDISKEDLANITFYNYKIINVNSGEVALRGMLNDKGEEGDQIAGDGIYSAIIKFEQDGEFQALFGVTTPTFTRQQRFPITVSKELLGIKMIYEKEGEETNENHKDETNHFQEENNLNLEELTNSELEEKLKEMDAKIQEHPEEHPEAHVDGHTDRHPEQHSGIEEKPPSQQSQLLKSIQVNLNEDLAKLASPKVKLILKKINLEKPIQKKEKKHDKKKEEKTEKNKDTFIITLKPTKDNSLKYEYPVEKLEAGEYQVYARLSARDETGKEFTAFSSTIKVELDEKEGLLTYQIDELKLIVGVSGIFISFIWISVVTLLIRSKNSFKDTFFAVSKEGLVSENLKQQIEVVRSKVSDKKRKPSTKDLEIFSEVSDIFGADQGETKEENSETEQALPEEVNKNENELATSEQTSTEGKEEINENTEQKN